MSVVQSEIAQKLQFCKSDVDAIYVANQIEPEQERNKSPRYFRIEFSR
jgi:hypothetical protein